MPVLSDITHILLADDDKDDNILFQDVLEEVILTTQLTTVNNGEQLMQLLNEKEELPDILFLDLNMPRKNGFECLSEIKRSERLKHIPVIIFSTSYEPETVNLLYNKGAQYYIRKPNDFAQFKKIIYQALTLTGQTDISQPPREMFVLSQQPINDESK
jgi:CheY-like chemotaxis protein